MNTSTMMANTHQRILEAQANKILAQAGYKPDGRVKTAKRESLRAVSIPCGGKTGYRRK